MLKSRFHLCKASRSCREGFRAAEAMRMYAGGSAPYREISLKMENFAAALVCQGMQLFRRGKNGGVL